MWKFFRRNGPKKPKGPEMSVEIMPIDQALGELHDSPFAVGSESFELWFAILFVGDRATCCDEAAVVRNAGEIISIATISPNGENGSGQTGIVGVYTFQSFRRFGAGKMALEGAIKRCLERGFAKVRVDAMTRGGLATVEALEPALLSQLDVRDLSHLGSMLPE